MKNTFKSKLLLSIFIDFLFLLLLISICIGAFFALRALFSVDKKVSGEIKIRSELMPREHSLDISVGDAVYDPLTKRRVGSVSDIEIRECGDNVYFLLTLDASIMPRGSSLRTEELWFYFTLRE